MKKLLRSFLCLYYYYFINIFIFAVVEFALDVDLDFNVLRCRADIIIRDNDRAETKLQALVYDIHGGGCRKAMLGV